MATHIITPTNSILGAGIGIDDATPSTFLITQSAYVVSTGTSAIRSTGAGSTLTIAGHLVGATDATLAIGDSTALPSVLGQTTVALTAGSTVSGTIGVGLFSSNNSLSNAGDINASAVGIRNLGSSNTLSNTGHIHGTTSGIFSSEFVAITNAGDITGGDGIYMASGSVTNNGRISGTNGILTAAAVSQQVDIFNTGSITGTSNAISVGLGTLNLTNDGTITGRIALGGTLDQANILTNNGTISGDISLGTLPGGFASIEVNNTGTIQGSNVTIDVQSIFVNSGNINVRVLTLSRFADYLDTTNGTISGTTDLGDGNDYYYGSVGYDDVIGGLGNDEIFFGAGDDFCSMGDMDGVSDGDDEYDGGDGIDIIAAFTTFGGITFNLEAGYTSGALTGFDAIANFENVTGTLFGDTIIGDAGVNRLHGRAGNDNINGLSGADRIIGGYGLDVVTGGFGRDVLSGSQHTVLDAVRDVFDYNAVAETGVTGATRDVITDFEIGIDDIDLRTIDANTTLVGNQAFAFIGTSAFSSAGQVRYQVIGTQTIVSGDVNGDALADFSIGLLKTPIVSAVDFLL